MTEHPAPVLSTKSEWPQAGCARAWPASFDVRIRRIIPFSDRTGPFDHRPSGHASLPDSFSFHRFAIRERWGDFIFQTPSLPRAYRSFWSENGISRAKRGCSGTLIRNTRSIVPRGRDVECGIDAAPPGGAGLSSRGPIPAEKRTRRRLRCANDRRTEELRFGVGGARMRSKQNV